MSKASQAAVKGKGKKAMPKKKCCVSKDRCRRCPLRMLKEGTLPQGYAVKKRKLVKVDLLGSPVAKPAEPGKKSTKKSGKKKLPQAA